MGKRKTQPSNQVCWGKCWTLGAKLEPKPRGSPACLPAVSLSDGWPQAPRWLWPRGFCPETKQTLADFTSKPSISFVSAVCSPQSRLLAWQSWSGVVSARGGGRGAQLGEEMHPSVPVLGTYQCREHHWWCLGPPTLQSAPAPRGSGCTGAGPDSCLNGHAMLVRSPGCHFLPFQVSCLWQMAKSLGRVVWIAFSRSSLLFFIIQSLPSLSCLVVWKFLNWENPACSPPVFSDHFETLGCCPVPDA